MTTCPSFNFERQQGWIAAKTSGVAKRLDCGGFSTALGCDGVILSNLTAGSKTSLKTTQSRRFARFNTNCYRRTERRLFAPNHTLEHHLL
jgi:hypothetical protein